MKQKTDKQNSTFSWKRILWFLFFIWIIAVMVNSFLFEDVDTGNVAIIEINGVISSQSQGGIFSDNYANPDNIIPFIDKAENDPMIKAVVFEINSPGGSPVASDEIASRIEKMNKTSIAHIREMGASGAYWIAASTNHIVANRMSVVGSIGVIGAYLSFENLLTKYNITYNRLVAGKYKDVGSPFKKLDVEEKDILQNFMDELHQDFILHVAKSRGLDYDYVKNLATGEFWTGKKAYELKLVDEIGVDATDFLAKKLNSSIDYVKYEHELKFTDILANMANDFGRSIGFGLGGSIFSNKGVTI